MWTVCVLFIVIATVGSIWLYSKLSTGYCKCSKHLVGKVAIVTGANTGVGFETAKDFAERGARVILACRNEAKGISARDKIRALSRNDNVHFLHLDLSFFDSVRKFAAEIYKTEQQIHILVNNGACYPNTLEKTRDGLLLGMQTNYFSHYLLTSLLIPILRQSAPSRIINVSSNGHRFGFINLENLNMERSKPYFANHFDYFNSKLCNILIIKALDRRFKGSGVTINALNPGLVSTNMVKQMTVGNILNVFTPFFKSPRAGAQTSIYLAVSPDVEQVSGCYFENCRLAKPSTEAQGVELAEKLLFLTEQIVNNKNNLL